MRNLSLLFLLFAFNSYAADFSPTPMTITVQPQLEYKFDGSPLEIPFSLSGKPGAIWLVINTHGQAENIVNVRNGHLGWHYVNKIDTTIYISQKFERDPGENTLIWDGRDENGNVPESGIYDYYLWGYDDKSDRELVCKFIRIGHSRSAQFTKIYEYDENGLPLTNPLIMGAVNPSYSYYYTYVNYYEPFDTVYNRSGTHFKWVIGNNPLDNSLLQTSICEMYYPPKDRHARLDKLLTGNPEWIGYGGPIFDPKDYNTFYHTSMKNIPIETPQGTYYQTYYTVYKWEFATGGSAIIDNDWLGWDNAVWVLEDNGLSMPSCNTDNNYIYISDPNYGEDVISQNSRLKCVTFEGDVIIDKLMPERYMPESSSRRGGMDCLIDKLHSRTSNNLFLLSESCCLFELINTSRLLNDSDDETDMLVFQNKNGDYFLDNGWAENIEYPWICVPGFFPPGDYRDYLRRYSICSDANNFSMVFFGNYGGAYGLASFGIATQDGSGIGYMAFGDDTATGADKAGGQLCDNGSAFDGIYMQHSLNYKDWETNPEVHYVAFDSAHGLITNNPAVQEQNPIQFKVSQNTPNPFNPSTTISFSIPEKSNVSVDIYNITGQKIKTLINGPMSAGEHSVKWDANGFSAGVYFYKVKAGKYEKTMKMMLVR